MTVTVSFSKVTMLILLKEWLLIVFPIYGKHVAEPIWLTKVCNSRNFSFGFYVKKKLEKPPQKV